MCPTTGGNLDNRGNVSIFTTDGQMLRSQDYEGIDYVNLDLYGFKSAVYFISVNHNGLAPEVFKLIVVE